MISEREPAMVSCRNMQEVKEYMSDIDKKALELSRREKKKDIKSKESK